MDQNTVRDTVQVAPVLPADARNIARALEEAGRLRWLVTGYVYRSRGWLERCCAAADYATRGRLVRLLRRRSLEGIPPERIRCRPARTAAAFLGRRLLRAGAETGGDEDGLFQALDRFAAGSAIAATTRLVVGREDSALASFRKAKQVGAVKLYDLPTAHHATVRRVVGEEEARFPGVCGFPPVASCLTPRRVAHKDEELAAGDWFVVGSEFVRRSLADQGYPAERVTVLPLACEEPATRTQPRESPASSDAVLHAGRLCLRKGTHRLLRAWKRLRAYHTHRLRLAGDMWLTPRFLADYGGCFDYLGRLTRDELKKQYATASFFVLPALAEGCAAVIPEALSCGLPVLASRNSGAEGFLTHGRECLLHEAGDEDELCAHLDQLLSQARRRTEMAREASLRARSWTWQHYRQRFIELLPTLDGEWDSGGQPGHGSNLTETWVGT